MEDETLGNYERQYWNLHQSHGRGTLERAGAHSESIVVFLSLDSGKFLFCSSLS